MDYLQNSAKLAGGSIPRQTLRQFQPKIKNSYFFLFTNELIVYIVRSRAQVKTGGMAEW